MAAFLPHCACLLVCLFYLTGFTWLVILLNYCSGFMNSPDDVMRLGYNFMNALPKGTSAPNWLLNPGPSMRETTALPLSHRASFSEVHRIEKVWGHRNILYDCDFIFIIPIMLFNFVDRETCINRAVSMLWWSCIQTMTGAKMTTRHSHLSKVRGSLLSMFGANWQHYSHHILSNDADELIINYVMILWK